MLDYRHAKPRNKPAKSSNHWRFFSGRSFAVDFSGHFAGYTLHPALAQRFGRANGPVVHALGALHLAHPLFWMIGDLPDIGWGGAIVVGQRLELAALDRARLFSGPLHQLDLAGLGHGQQGIGIQAGDRFEDGGH